MKHNALVPAYHCMHTPGGPLKYSLQGHQFAIFAMKISADNRYIISCSNKFITFDVVTSDLARQVYPRTQGLMMGLELSPDNKFAAAYTNNNQTILLNTLISEFTIIENFLSSSETVLGMCLLDTSIVIYGQKTWGIFNLKGKLVEKKQFEAKGEMLSLRMLDSLDSFSLISWSGSLEDPHMSLSTTQEGRQAEPLAGHSVITTNPRQTLAILCDTAGSHTVAMYRFQEGGWVILREELLFSSAPGNAERRAFARIGSLQS